MNIECFIETRTDVDDDKKTKSFKQINFMLCESCLWCASSLSSSSIYDLSNDDTVPKCPICNEYTLKLIPIYNKSLLQSAGWGQNRSNCIMDNEK
jgi:hypothetical protein